MEIKKAQMVRWLKGYSEDMFISLLARETAKAILSEMKRLRRIERAARKWSVFELSPGDFMDTNAVTSAVIHTEPVHLYNAPRFGIRWNGPSWPLAVSMDDGYWTPWHLADARERALRARVAELERERDEARADAYEKAQALAAVSGILFGTEVPATWDSYGAVADARRSVLGRDATLRSLKDSREVEAVALRERDEARTDKGNIALALGIECANNLAARARVAELEREVEDMRERARNAEAQRDEAVSLAHESLAETVAARADAARLREALTQVRDAMLATGQEPDGDDDPRRPVATAVWRALASAPSAEPTRNQCDGCAAGRPVDAHGMHRMSDGDGFACNYQQCQAHRYGSPTPRDMRVDESDAEAARLREALGDFLNCPMVVSEGTNPVIVTIHVARERVEKWRAALASAPSAAVVAKAVGK